MSTNTQPASTDHVLRRQKDGSRTSVPCPEAIVLYNTNMGAVDRGDQLRGYYNCRTKSRKFYKYTSFTFFLTSASSMLSFSTRTSAQHPNARSSRISVYSWRGSSLETIVLVVELVVVVVLFSPSHCSTSHSRLDLILPIEKEDVVLTVDSTTTNVLIPLGFVGNVGCGYATVEIPAVTASSCGISREWGRSTDVQSQSVCIIYMCMYNYHVCACVHVLVCIISIAMQSHL